MANSEMQSAIESIKNSPSLRIVIICFLILVLQIPVQMIRGVIRERQSRQQEAIRDITSKWGEAQTIVGPLLTVPYLVEFTEKDEDGDVTVRTAIRHANFLPENVKTSGKIDSQVRQRGIFAVPIYHMNLGVSGEFTRPDFSEWEIDPERILWDRAHLTVRISDVHAISNPAALDWNGEEIGFSPGTGEFGGGSAGIHARLRGLRENKNYSFSYPLSLNGSQSVYFAPLGRGTSVEIESDWGAPSFQGRWLPSRHTSDGDGFQATWNIPFLGSNYPVKWRSGTETEKAIGESLFGVDFITPVNHYRMAQRSVKYAALFLVLTFATLWLFEILVYTQIHPIQYLLVGAGMCIFYLLGVSLAEHIGFMAAYVCASAAVIALVSLYCAAVLKGSKHAAIVGTAMTLLYGYLYIVLMNQDYALLVGSIGLFTMLGAVMYLTRNKDWYSLKP